ncbi:MAG: hypothetical protein AB7T10_09325 [bacterium]
MNDLNFLSEYRENRNLRLSFNKLANETFGIDFEDWIQNRLVQPEHSGGG